MVMPRSFSSGALSISSNGVKSARPLSASTFVMAAVRVVLPWSMWPMVPMFTCGLVRSKRFLDISLFSSHARNDLARQALWHFPVRVQLHGRVGRAPLRSGPQLRRVAEQLRERDAHPDRAHGRPLVDPFDAATAGPGGRHPVAHELLGGQDR